MRLFLSYARGDDEAFVRRLYAQLAAAGFTVWFDRVSMPSRQLSFFQEIRDEINVCDRVIFVVGPKAASSDYVTQEWRFGLEVGKGINPIVRLAGTNGDGYELIPEELKTLHAEDFRDDAKFDDHFENLVRQLSQPVAPPGRLIGVPTLPTHYRAHPERLKVLKSDLLADLQRPVVVTGAAARVGVQGMGGIGKTVLAISLARDLETRRAFPDGVLWVAVGQQPNILEIQRNIVRALQGEVTFDNVDAGREVLRLLFETKAILLILDDVWVLPHVQAFDVIGPRSRLLLTTRDSALVSTVAGSGFQVELPSETEALAMLAASAGATSLPSVAKEIVEEVGRLPLALALCGGMAASLTPWTDILAALREQDLEFIKTEHASEPQHLNVWRAMEVSVAFLSELQQARFADLAVFAQGAQIPEAAIVTLWSYTGGLNERDCRQLLISFKDRALVQLDVPVGAANDVRSAHMSLHDLLYDIAAQRARVLFGSETTLHAQLLAAYATRCSDDWSKGPPDGYFFQHLRTHMVRAERVEEFVRLVLRPEWLELKSTLSTANNSRRVSEYGDIYDLLEDFRFGLAAATPSSELEFAKYLSQIVSAQFPTWIDAPNRLYPQLYPFLKGAPTAVAGAAQAWLDKYFSRSSAFGPWFRQLTPIAHDPSEDSVTIQIEGESPAMLAFSSDGQVLVGASYLKARAWRVITARELFSRDTDVFTAVLVAEVDEERNFLVVSGNGAILRINNKGEVYETPGPKIGISSADLAPGGRRLAIGDQFGQLGIWDLETGNWALRRRASRTPIRAVCFDRSGDRLLVARENGLFNCFESQKLEPVLERPLSGNILRALPGPSNGSWYLGGLDGSVKRWQLGGQSEIALSETGRSPISLLSRSGDVFLAADLLGDIRVWDVSTEEFRGQASFGDGPIRAIALSGDRLAMSSGAETVRILSLSSAIGSSGGSTPSICTPPSWLGDCKRAISGTESGDVAVVSGEQQPTPVMSHVAQFDGPAAGLGSADLWAGGVGSDIVILKPMKRRVIGRGQASGQVSSIGIDGSGSITAAGFGTGLSVVWESRSAGELGRIQMHTGRVAALAFANDASLLLSAGEDSAVTLWQLKLRESKEGEFINVVQGRALPRLEASNVKSVVAHTSLRPVSALALTQDNERLMIAIENRLLIWSFPALEPITEKTHSRGILSRISVSPDGSYLAGLSVEGRCVIWKIDDWSIACEFQTFRPGLGCDWSPDGRAIVIAAGERLMIFCFEGLLTGDPIVMPIPTKNEKVMRLSCPHQRLRKAWRVASSKLGETVICPECGGRVRIARTMLQPLEVKGNYGK
jgi:WD40 repeat protein